jgi:hypothetical protein
VKTLCFSKTDLTSQAAAESTEESPRGDVHENRAVFALQLLQAAATAPPAAWNADAPFLASDRVLLFPKPTRVKKRAGAPCQNDMLLPCVRPHASAQVQQKSGGGNHSASPVGGYRYPKRKGPGTVGVIKQRSAAAAATAGNVSCLADIQQKLVCRCSVTERNN